jgi:molybdate transport system ATP-binding protein
MLDQRSPLFARTHRYVSAFPARLLRHDDVLGLSTLLFAGGELRVPLVDAAVGTVVEAEIDGSDVSIALSRPMDVTILNRLPGEIVSLQRLSPPFVVATLSLGGAELQAIITRESVERLALIEGLRAWAMIKAVAISGRTLDPDAAPYPRRWPSSDRTSSRTR